MQFKLFAQDALRYFTGVCMAFMSRAEIQLLIDAAMQEAEDQMHAVMQSDGIHINPTDIYRLRIG